METELRSSTATTTPWVVQTARSLRSTQRMTSQWRTSLDSLLPAEIEAP
jgi:hypothetical protein